MKKKSAALFLAVALAVSLGLVPTVVAAVTSISGGNSVIQRTQPDNAHGINMVEMNNAIGDDGVITSWSIWADRTTPVKLKIYRATADPNIFTVVGQSALVTPSLGVNTFTLSAPILVKAGDYIGWRYPVSGSGAGSISYDRTAGSVRWSPYPTAQDGANGGTDSLPLTDAVGRVYSIAVSGSTIELTARQDTDVNPVLTAHTVTADVGVDLEGVTVHFDIFNISSPNYGESQTENTASSGEVTFGYVGDGGSGTDTITIWIDQNGNGIFDSGDDPSVELTKNWIDETPPLEVGGEVYPVNRMAILAPWIALTAVIIAGVTMAVRRRRVRS